MNKLNKEINQDENLLKKYKDNLSQLYNLIEMIENELNQINSSDETQNNTENNSKIDINKLSNDDACKFAFFLIAKLKELLQKSSSENFYKKESFIQEKLNQLKQYNNSNNSSIITSLFSEILHHKKFKSWNKNVIKFAFLIKYCSSASYFRLFTMLDKQIPPPDTVESHFRKKVIQREKQLLNADAVNELLNQYLIDIKEQINNYINIYNKEFQTNITYDTFKLNVCLGCDAASLTPFTHLKKQKSKKIKKDKKSKYNSVKKLLYERLLKGQFNEDDFKEIIDNNLEIPDNKTRFFFTILLQPFVFNFPVFVIHLTKSANGHFSLKEAIDVNKLFNIINSHPKFEAHFFSADGETSLDDLHKLAFEMYESMLNKVIKGEITFNDLFQYIKTQCIVLPLLDVFHGVKSGRNKIINNILKIGKKCNLISSDELKEILELDDATLDDKSTLGKMNDQYALNLFKIHNVIKAYNKNHNASGLYLLVFTLILEVFRNVYLELQFRIDLSKLVLFLLCFFYQNIFNLPQNTCLKKNKKKQKKICMV